MVTWNEWAFHGLTMHAITRDENLSALTDYSVYYRNKSTINIEVLLTKRRLYRIAKRRAKCKFNRTKKIHNFAKNKPQQFWKEIRKLKSKTSSTCNKQVVHAIYRKMNYMTILKNCLLIKMFNLMILWRKSWIMNIFVNNNHVETLDCDFTEDNIVKAIDALKCGKVGLLIIYLLKCLNVVKQILHRYFVNFSIIS